MAGAARRFAPAFFEVWHLVTLNVILVRALTLKLVTTIGESMAGNAAPVDALMEMIRSDSTRTVLSPASVLASALAAGEDPVAILEADAKDDIKLMRGSRDCYFFSERSMTAAFAMHLYRIAERDPLRLIAQTVRDESRIYPRPTPMETFSLPPFSMSPAEVDQAVASMAGNPAYADIRRTDASDGERYLYSAEHISDAHAAGLAEWTSVGEKDNP
jgi:hypothetical protein